MNHLPYSYSVSEHSEVVGEAALLTPPPSPPHLPRKPHNEVNEVNEVRRLLARSPRPRLPHSKRIGRLL